MRDVPSRAGSLFSYWSSAEQQDKVGCLPAQLQSETSAFERPHRWRAPVAMERFSAAIGYHSAAIAAADTNRKLQDRGQDDDTVRLVQHALGSAVGRSKNLLHYLSGVLNAILLLVLPECWQRQCDNQAQAKQYSLHGFFPRTRH